MKVWHRSRSTTFFLLCIAAQCSDLLCSDLQCSEPHCRILAPVFCSNRHRFLHQPRRHAHPCRRAACFCTCLGPHATTRICHCLLSSLALFVLGSFCLALFCFFLDLSYTVESLDQRTTEKRKLRSKLGEVLGRTSPLSLDSTISAQPWPTHFFREPTFEAFFGAIPAPRDGQINRFSLPQASYPPGGPDLRATAPSHSFDRY